MSTRGMRRRPQRDSSRLLPWIAMGLAGGIGYCGLEAILLKWYYNNITAHEKDSSQREKRRKLKPVHEQLTRHMQQMGSLFSVSDAKAWLSRCWAVPFFNHDILFGVVVAVLPSVVSDHKENVTSASGALARSGAASRVLLGSSTSTSSTSTSSSAPPKEAGPEFPQLHAGLPPNAPAPNNKPHQAPKKERYLEMLLHNISHTDLVLGLALPSSSLTTTTTSSSLASMCLCRPRFSAFDLYCRKLLQALEPSVLPSADSDKAPDAEAPADIILVPQYQRSQDDPRYTLQPSDRPHVATGFCWKQTTKNTSTDDGHQATAAAANNRNPRNMSLSEALADLRVRGKDMAKLDPYIKTTSEKHHPVTIVPASPRFGDKENTPSSPTTSSWNLVTSAFESSSAPTPNIANPAPSTTSTNTAPPPIREDVLVELKAIFFPLLATLLPRWHAQIAHKYGNQQQRNNTTEIHKVLVLVTGVGTPRNWTHSIAGNSTQALAELMELFLAKVYPDITVTKIHSKTNIFRYDDNIIFVQQELLPHVNAYRDAHATQAPYPHELVRGSSGQQNRAATAGGCTQQLKPHAKDSKKAFDVDWKKSFAVTLSFADGSPARTHAIQASLRTFRPTYFHMWQLKTFWHDRKIVDGDVEVHSFEEMETSPALESSDIQGDLDLVVHEMKAFRQEMTETLLRKDDCDIHSFWLRKTHKPVLAVLLVQSEGLPPVLYRGTNMEVSMPTGSLCAERNVIGTALASNPRLKRQDLKCIAVLAVPQPSETGASNPPGPPRAASASLDSARDNNTSGSCTSSTQSSMDETNTATMTGRQMRSQSFDEREEDRAICYGSDDSNKNRTNKTDVMAEGLKHQDARHQNPSTPIRKISLFSSESSNSLVDLIKQNPLRSSGSPSMPTKPNSSSSLAPGAAGKEKRTEFVRSNNHDIDLNPLRPCGACHEWLKKIAECNPYFQIMTFTDAGCNGVYLTPCQE